MGAGEATGAPRRPHGRRPPAALARRMASACPPVPHLHRPLQCPQTLAPPYKYRFPASSPKIRRRPFGDFSLYTTRREEERGRKRSWGRGELEAARGRARSRRAAGPPGRRPSCRGGRLKGDAHAWTAKEPELFKPPTTAPSPSRAPSLLPLLHRAFFAACRSTR
jgi:hypothetical protein